MEDADFTSFMIRCMEGKDNVTDAIFIYRLDDGTIGYRAFNQDMADSLGMLRFASMSVENDLINNWKD
jgi:hypothetical protein